MAAISTPNRPTSLNYNDKKTETKENTLNTGKRSFERSVSFSPTVEHIPDSRFPHPDIQTTRSDFLYIRSQSDDGIGYKEAEMTEISSSCSESESEEEVNTEALDEDEKQKLLDELKHWQKEILKKRTDLEIEKSRPESRVNGEVFSTIISKISLLNKEISELRVALGYAARGLKVTK